MSRKLNAEQKRLNKLINEKGRLAMQEALLGTRFDLVKNRMREVETQIRELSGQIHNAGNDGFPRLNEHEKGLCQEGDYLNAIKALRERLNIPVLEAKDIIGHYRETNNLVHRV